MAWAEPPRRGEQGFSIVESVIAIAVLGIIVSAIVGGMATSISMSALHRQQASVNAVMVSAAEVVKHLPYQDCASPPYSTASVPLPTGWSSSSISLQIQYWDGSTTFDSICRDSGSPFPMQLVTILITAPGAPVISSSVAVVKRRP